MSDLERVAQLAQQIEEMGGKCSEPVRLPDGSGCFTASMPLPNDHWLYAEGFNVPPMPLRMRAGSMRDATERSVRAAAQYAVRCATMNGKDPDFDPDALVQNMQVGLLGYATEDGRSSLEESHNPKPVPRLAAVVADYVVPELERQRDALWALLDDIDTLDDACKGDDAEFRRRCYELQRKRFAIHDPEGSAGRSPGEVGRDV